MDKQSSGGQSAKVQIIVALIGAGSSIIVAIINLSKVSSGNSASTVQNGSNNTAVTNMSTESSFIGVVFLIAFLLFLGAALFIWLRARKNNQQQTPTYSKSSQPKAQNALPPLLPAAQLVIRSPQGVQQIYHIEHPVIRIGHQPDNDIVLPDQSAGHHHAVIEYNNKGQFVLTDLKSHNGTFVRNTPMTSPYPLHTNDTFSIGKYEFSFESPHTN